MESHRLRDNFEKTGQYIKNLESEVNAKELDSHEQNKKDFPDKCGDYK